MFSTLSPYILTQHYICSLFIVYLEAQGNIIVCFYIPIKGMLINMQELEFKEFAQRPDSYAKIFSMIAPSIYGHADVKKAVACLLFGGSRKVNPKLCFFHGHADIQ